MIERSRLLLAVVLCALALLLVPQGAEATALTTYLAPSERSCFYADVDSEYTRAASLWRMAEHVTLALTEAGEKIGARVPFLHPDSGE